MIPPVRDQCLKDSYVGSHNLDFFPTAIFLLWLKAEVDNGERGINTMQHQKRDLSIFKGFTNFHKSNTDAWHGTTDERPLTTIEAKHSSTNQIRKERWSDGTIEQWLTRKYESRRCTNGNTTLEEPRDMVRLLICQERLQPTPPPHYFMSLASFNAAEHWLDLPPQTLFYLQNMWGVNSRDFVGVVGRKFEKGSTLGKFEIVGLYVSENFKVLSVKKS